ncbi:unnamed protein product, partial [marine sediment metagenome]
EIVTLIQGCTSYPFDAHFPDDGPDTIRGLGKQLASLKVQMSIAKWAVEGAVDYFKMGSLNPPKIITTLVQSYEEEMDHVVKFIRDMAIKDSTGWTPWARVVEDYNLFVEEEEVPLDQRMKPRTLGVRLGKLGYPAVVGAHNVAGRQGFRLNSIIPLDLDNPPTEVVPIAKQEGAEGLDARGLPKPLEGVLYPLSDEQEGEA